MIDGKAIFEFGSGDIQFVAYPGEVDDKEVFALCFKSMPNNGHPIGIVHEEITWDPQNPDVLMIFPSIEYAKEVVESMKKIIEAWESSTDEEEENSDVEG